MRLTYLKKPYFVTMGTFHMGILLHFNNADVLSFTELLQNTTLPEKELTKQLQSLVDTKIVSTEVCMDEIIFINKNEKNVSVSQCPGATLDDQLG